MSLQEDVETTLATGLRGLRFSPALEERYEADTRKSRCRGHVGIGLVSLAIYDIFLLTDLTMIPDIFDLAVITRLGVVTPLILSILFIVSHDPSPAIRETVVCLLPPIIVGSILYLMLLSEAPLRQYQHTGVILVMLFPVIAQNMQFRYALLGVILCLALYIGALLQVAEIPPIVKQSAIMLQIAAAVFMMIACYRIEHQTRRFYLYGLRDRLRNEQLDTMSKTDPLTGLLNRRALEATLDLLWAEATRTRTPLSVLLLDIDHFKSFNDRYGHLQGDVCIRNVATTAAGVLRPSQDLAVRFGGEELVFVLPGLDLGEARSVAERIRAAVEGLAIAHEGGTPGGIVTVSIGVATTVPSSLVMPQEVLMGADAALYVAKRGGRNQVCPKAPQSEKVDAPFSLAS